MRTHLGGVGVQEPGGGDQVAGARDLDRAEVDAGDLVAAGGQVTGERHARATAEIQDGAAGRDPLAKPASQVA